MHKSELNLLKRLGLSAHESAVYLALIDGGPANLSELSARTGIHRAMIYKAVPKLTEHGLVATTPIGKRLYYTAAPPEQLRTEFDSFTADFAKLLPSLEQRRCLNSTRPAVRIFDGVLGIRSVLDDMMRTLKKGEIYYRYSSRKQSTDVERFLSGNYRRLRDEKQLERFVITSARLAATKKNRLDRAIKTVPATAGGFDFDVNVVIYADKVAYLDYNTETALVITNPMIAAFHKKIFKLLYDSLA